MLVLPATYFGNIAYYERLLHQEALALSSDELFVKQTFRNRCSILSANGIQNLSIPIERPQGRETKMKNAVITYEENWRKDHLKALEAAYSRSPYYEYYIDELREIFDREIQSLLDFNLELTKWIIDKTDINCQIEAASEMEPEVSDKILVDPKQAPAFEGKSYIQTYADKYPFSPNLSIIDLLFNEGPNSITILSS